MLFTLVKVSDIFRRQILEHLMSGFFSSVEKYYSITLFFVCVFAFTPGNFELTIHFYVETTIHSVSTEHRKDITLSISCLKSVVS